MLSNTITLRLYACPSVDLFLPRVVEEAFGQGRFRLWRSIGTHGNQSKIRRLNIAENCPSRDDSILGSGGEAGEPKRSFSSQGTSSKVGEKAKISQVPSATGKPRPQVRLKYDGKSLKDAMNHCLNMVKERDGEFYQWCVQLDKDHRAPVLVLKALSLEIESIQWQARTDTLLQMRYQWWRDSIRKAFKATHSYEMSQPVMKAVSELVGCHPISQHRMEAMVDAFEKDALRTSPMSTVAELSEFADGTQSQMLCMQLEACGMSGSESEQAAFHLGKAMGLSATLRHAVAYLKKGKSYFPEEICRKYNATPVDFDVDGQSVLPRISMDIAMLAQSHLEASRSSPTESASIFIQGLNTELYLGALQKAEYDIFSAKMHKGGYLPIEYLMKLKWRFWRNT